MIDNASTDGSAEILSSLSVEFEVHRMSSNLGFAAANNFALETLEDCDWVALLNPDTLASITWIEELKDAIQRFPDAGMFSCRLVNSEDPSLLDGTGDHYHVNGLSWRRDHGQSITRFRAVEDTVFCPCAAAAMYRLSAVRQVGFFDQSYFCYNEDVDLGFRLRLNGVQCIHLDKCEVHHAGSGITGRDSDFSIYYGHRNLVWTFIKNMPGKYLWLYLPQHVLLNIVSILFYTVKGRPGVILRAKWDALKGLGRALSARKIIQKNRKVNAVEVVTHMQRNVFSPYFKRHV